LDRYEHAITSTKKNTNLWRQVSEIQTILPEYELRYLRAVSYLLLDRPEQASQLLEEMLGDKNVPTLVQDSARMHLVLAYFALANHDKAAQVLSKITDRSVMNYFPFELFREITTLKRYDRYEIAIAVLDDLLRSLTTPAMQMPIWMAKAEMYWANGQWDRASEIYGGIVSLPTDQFIVDRASDKKLELEPLDDGIENGEDRIKGLLSALRSHLRPDEDAAGIQAMSAYRIGLTHSRNRKTSEALKSFETAKTLAPSSTWAIAAQSEINTIRFNQTYGESLRKQVGRQPTSEQGGLR
jgi:tetratricopeptide (TPR) repeat protein